jgi:MFS family permease
MNFSYGFAMACQGLLVVPSEAKHLWPQHASEALGAMAILAGMSQLAGPEAGHYSDMYRSKYGRRRPIMIVCTAALWTSSFACWFFSNQGWNMSFIVMFFLMQMVWNIMYATAQGLVPDLILEQSHGLAGSASAAHVLMGSLLAFLCMMVLPNLEYHSYYAISAVLTGATCVVVCHAAREASTENRIDEANDSAKGMWSFLERYKLDVFRYWDFFLLLVTKTIYCALVVSKGFLMYFLRDVFNYSGGTQQKDLMALLGKVSMAAEVSAVIAALTVMFCFGTSKSGSAAAEATPLLKGALRKPWSQWAILLGSVWMAIWWNGPTYLALLRMTNPVSAIDPMGWRSLLLAGNLIWGLGQGVYLAGDQALALALLPSKKDASRYLSFNCLCAFVGTSIGGLIVGTLLAVLGSGVEKGYGFPGYVAVFTFASVSSAALAAVSYFIHVLPKKALAGP